MLEIVKLLKTYKCKITPVTYCPESPKITSKFNDKKLL